MARKVAEGTSVAWLNADHPNATDGEGYYEVLKDNEHELDGNGHPIFTNTEVQYGKKLVWKKDRKDEEGEDGDENNEGHFVYPKGGEN